MKVSIFRIIVFNLFFFLGLSALQAQVKVVENGDVGIKNPNPTAPLHVKGVEGIKMTNGVDIQLKHRSDDLSFLIRNVEKMRLVYEGNSKGQLLVPRSQANRPSFSFIEDRSAGMYGSGNIADSKLFLATNYTKRLTINHTGQVGIGIEPTAPLQVEGLNGIKLTNQGYDKEIKHNTHDFSFLSEGAEKMRIVHENGNNGQILAPSSQANRPSFSFLTNQSAGMWGSSSSSTSELYFGTDYARRVTINHGGNVGINTTNPTERLHVVGNICYTGTNAACSDLRYKKDLVKLNSALGTLNHINAYKYSWKTDKYPEKEFTKDLQIGFIAQEIQAIYPEMVLEDQDGYLSVDYSKMTVVLLQAVKELKAENDALKEKQNLRDVALLEIVNRLMLLESAKISSENPLSTHMDGKK